MLERTSTAWAPWHVVPADRTSVRNAVISALLVDALDALQLEWPTLDPAVAAQKIT
jgi:polyphosphate kinase 2 (PPK2 family)